MPSENAAQMKCLDYLGWIGAFIILAMFACNLSGMQVSSILYQSLNLVGAALVAATSYASTAWPAVLINICWAITSIVFIVKDIK